MRSALLLGTMALVIIVASGCASTTDDSDAANSAEALSERQCGQDPFAADSVRGIDVSKHQGTVDFGKIAATDNTRLTSKMFNVGTTTRSPKTIPGKVVFAVARVSDGLTTKDGQIFTDNFNHIRAAGLVPGAYQFLRPNQDATAQAQYFIQELDNVGGYNPGDIPPTVDIEVSDGTTPAAVQAGVTTWLKVVGDHYKVRPIVYSLAGVSSYLGTKLTASPLWIANFYQNCPKMPSAWVDTSTRWAFFQFDDAGKVDGVASDNFVDLDIFNGNRAAFDKFLEESYLGN